MRDILEINRSVSVLRENLSNTARVSEWAELMGYKCPKRFARMFLRHYATRPQRILEYIRIKSITKQLRDDRFSNFEIARAHGIADEIALNKFINYHLGCSPTYIKYLSTDKFRHLFDNMQVEHAVVD